MTLRDIGDALKAVVPDTYHHFAIKKTDKYIVWGEDGEGSSGAGDNHKTVQVITGTVDYFTREEYDANFNAIQTALNSLSIAWRLNSVQYEDITRFRHYEWAWEAIFDGNDIV